MLCRKLIQFSAIFFNKFLGQAQQQRFFRFGMMERPPHFMAKNSTADAQKYHGSWVQAIEWLSKRLDFTYKIIPTGLALGKVEMLNGSGSWSGASGRLLLKDFDVLGPPIVVSQGRNRAFEFVGAAQADNSALLTPALAEENTILSTIKPFQPTVWAMVLISLLAVAGCFAVTSALNLHRNGIRRNRLFLIGDYIFHLIAILTNQGDVITLHKHLFKLPFRLTASVWCLFALVMVNVYSSTLTAHLTARKMSTPPKDAFEIIEKGILAYLIIDDGLGRELILGATGGPLKKMGDVFRRHPEYIIPDQDTAFRKVASGCCSYTDLVNYLDYRIGQDFEETGKCRVHVGKPTSGYSFTALFLRKGDIYRSSINQGVLDLYQTGLVDHWKNKYGSRGLKLCQSTPMTKKLKELHRLNTIDLAGAFLILGVGLLLSLMAFLVEQYRRCNTCVN
ncbi:glutamate receptor ionotropic, kainate glr-3-like [Daphnia carinata]|uniref:glutamate receptor ionotropic, kainate glr-3-like n=1 Tax=Daphnia carinata TaxID=120202 RepID=UPI00257F24E4|nr:glutamate receptor ionotropic, kainate glr-3-like [Daphnia carinata]